MWLQRWWKVANNSGHKRGNILNVARRQVQKSCLDLRARIHSGGTQNGGGRRGRRWENWQHPEVYSHVEWQLHLSVGQQLRGYGCHFGGHQYPCQGGRGTRVRCILQTHREIQIRWLPFKTEHYSNICQQHFQLFSMHPWCYSKTHLTQVWMHPEAMNAEAMRLQSPAIRKSNDVRHIQLSECVIGE